VGSAAFFANLRADNRLQGVQHQVLQLQRLNLREGGEKVTSIRSILCSSIEAQPKLDFSLCKNTSVSL
jgi:hypothetical protein